jgi:hypothetical protein
MLFLCSNRKQKNHEKLIRKTQKQTTTSFLSPFYC